MIDLSLWDFRLESSPESGRYYLIFRFHCWRKRRGFVNTTYLPVALFSQHGAKLQPRDPLHQFLWTVREGKKETWVWLTDINLQMLKEKRFLRLYSVDAHICTLPRVPLSSSIWIHWWASYKSDTAKRSSSPNLLTSAITERRKQWPFRRKGCGLSHTHVSSLYLSNNMHRKKIVVAL